MAHFYARIKGQSGEATRIGSKRSGAVAYAQGWHCGGSATVRFDEQANRDLVTISLTSGSSGRNKSRTIASDVDAAAIVQAAEFDEITRQHLDTARRVMGRAEAAAHKALKRRDKFAQQAA